MAFKIYTKTGDDGTTGLFGGKRLPKHHIRIESYGTVDELNAHIGLIADLVSQNNLKILLHQVQNCLFTIGAKLATDPDKKLAVPDIFDEDTEVLENAIDAMENDLPALKNFILPGGHPTVSHCHIARCVCRRAERSTTALAETDVVDPKILRYLNRLSDFLFVLSRKTAQLENAPEVIWKPRT